MGRDVNKLFALFALSGFTGLIYESVWSHYLKLFLGAAAFSQSFVLAAFMGGMALGAWLASRWSARLANLLAAYGWIEAAIGVAALIFHEVFVLLTRLSLDHVIPALGSPDSVEIYKYSVCALLIVPQTVLLGMTFPLLSGAVIRRGPQASGHHLAMLYFTNSIGAAAGALASAFVLLGWLGMPGTMRLAGALNLALAAAVLAIARRGEPAAVAGAPAGPAPLSGKHISRLFLAGAFVTGLASFVYEIVWIRMLSLVLGSSFQAFELMLSAFITGLALGGLWIRRRIDRIADPVRYAGLVQVLMGIAALATVFVYHWTFDWMVWALHTFQRNDNAYPLFNLFSHGLAFAVMLPATFLAGMTLPLFTHVLLRGGTGERAIGQVYAANTLGAIAGVLLTVHLLVPGVGLKLALVLGACIDIVLGAWLLRYSQSAARRFLAWAGVLIGLLAATATARAAILDPVRLSSGVFRYGELVSDVVVFYQDGKTASVAVRREASSDTAAIVTNGKPDAGIRLDPKQPPTPDEYTMSLLPTLPLLIKPDAKTYAGIGWGSGLSAHVLLSHTGPRSLDNIEIEPAMFAGALAFGERTERAYRDGRSRVYFEDAKSYFARHGKRYDVIMTEPSNPWVNGVAGLFTTEFYRDTKRYLAPGGLFVQWVHTYELNDRLLGSVLAALGENFSDYEIYEANPGDLVIVAVAQGEVPRPGPLPEKESAFLKELRRLGLTRSDTISARSLGRRKQIEVLLATIAPQVNSDFHPVLQLEAPRARFATSASHAIQSLATAPLPILSMTGGAPASYLKEPSPAQDPSPRIRMQSAALEISRLLSDRASDPLRSGQKVATEVALVLKRPDALCAENPSEIAIDALQNAAETTLGGLAPDQARALWVERRWLGCVPRSAHIRERLEVYAAVAARDPKAMLSRARALLEVYVAGAARDPKAMPSRARAPLDGPAQSGDDWGKYLLSTAILGACAAGEYPEAAELWTRYNRTLYPTGNVPPYLFYLLGLQAQGKRQLISP